MASSSSELDKALETVFRTNLGVRKGERIVIVHDDAKKGLARLFLSAARSFASADLLRVPEMKVNGEEPPEHVAEKLSEYDVAVFVTSKSLSHTKARRDATARGMRIASMPGITKEILARSIRIDYPRLKEDTARVARMLDTARDVRIVSDAGTDFSFSISGRKAHGLKAGLFTKRGYWGNLPEGEAFIAPVEGTAEGCFVVDGSVAGLGKVGKRLRIRVEKGHAVAMTGGKMAEDFEKLLDAVGWEARNIAELGIGLNRKAKITGIVLEDEKAYGTCHIALGNNIGFGGRVDVPLHIDTVLRKPSIFLDGRCVMRKGKLL